MEKVSMIVLAGGMSSRMGRDKSDLKISGETFLERQIKKGRLLGIEDILVSGYRGEHCSARIVKDRIAGKGPLGGLEACLRAAENSQCLVIGVDVPLVPTEELKRLIVYATESGADAVVLQHGVHQEPLIGVYKTSLADAILEEITERKGAVFQFLKRIHSEWYQSGLTDEYFVNINDPVIYQEIIKKWR